MRSWKSYYIILDMILDITKDDDFIPILGRDWTIGISGRWFEGRPNGKRERAQLMDWIEKLNLDRAPFLDIETIWAFAKILDCKREGYRMYKPNRNAYVYIFYMPEGLSACPNPRILITLNKKMKLHGSAK